MPRSDQEQKKFDKFMQEVDASIYELTGGEIGSHLEFSDFDYSSSLESEMSPHDTALEALAADGFDPEGR